MKAPDKGENRGLRPKLRDDDVLAAVMVLMLAAVFIGLGFFLLLGVDGWTAVRVICFVLAGYLIGWFMGRTLR